MILPVQVYSSQNFTAKNFRLPIKGITYSLDGIPIYTEKFRGYKEFSNPEAEKIYNEAQKITDPLKRVKLLSEMGDFDIVDVKAEKTVDNYLKSSFP